MPAQDPYKPFENDRLPWLDPASESAAPAVSRQGGAKPAIVLLLSTEDVEVCHAVNFERVVFRDQAVVELARASFLNVRLDRGTDAAKGFQAKGPEIVVLASDGDEVARFNDCTQPRFVLAIMREALAISRDTAKSSAEWAPRIAKAEKLADEGRTRDAAELLVKARRERLSRPLRDRVTGLVQALEEKARALLDAAKAKDEASDPAGAWLGYRAVRDDFPGLAAASAAKAAMAALERDPEKKELMREARAEALVDHARALAHSGKKAQAITELRKVISDHSSTRAAATAKELIAELQDPSWKPRHEADPAEPR